MEFPQIYNEISFRASDHFTNYLMYNENIDLNDRANRNLVQYCNPYHINFLLTNYDQVINYMIRDGVKSVIDFGCGMGGFSWMGENRLDEIISVDCTDIFKPLRDVFQMDLDFRCNRIERDDFEIKGWNRKDKVDAMALIRFYPIESTRDKNKVKDYIGKLKHYANTIYIHSIETKSSRHLDKMGRRLNKYMWKI